jgi:fatty acid desaturase
MLGAVLGVVLFMPFSWWRHEHAVHHATTGDLDRRGTGDVQTLTVDEYRRSVLATDLALTVVIGALCLLVGWKEVLTRRHSRAAHTFAFRGSSSSSPGTSGSITSTT